MLFSQSFAFVFFINLIFLASKWLISIYLFDETLGTSILMNTGDIKYYPLIVSLSQFDLNPTFLDYYQDTKIINFPIASIFFHAVLYKLIGVYSFIILEFFFHFLLIFIVFKIINKLFNK